MSVATPTQEQGGLGTPPRSQTSIGLWLRENLFDGWFNTLLTILSLLLLYAILSPLLRWVLTSAEWAVIPANFNLLMRGRYPAEHADRLWVCLFLLSTVAGFAWGAFSRRIQTAALVMLAIPLVLMLVPFFSMATRINLLAMAGIGVGGYLLARIWPVAKSTTAVISLFAYPFIAVVIIRGFAESGFWEVVDTTLWGGLVLSTILTVFGILLSFPLGTLLALGRQNGAPVIKTVCTIYIEFIRGVPLITLLFMSQVMLQFFLPASVPPPDLVMRPLVAIALFSAAYTAENVRGGLQSIPRGQYEAGHAIGLNAFQRMVFIILPQALRAVIPVMVGQFISLFKDTSLVALVGLFELLGIARTVLSNPDWLGRSHEIYLFIALIYWAVNYSMAYGSRRLEEALGVGKR